MAYRHRLAALATLLPLAGAAPAQQVPATPPAPYARAIAAGYKALTLCEGIFAAGRSQAQIDATELKGIYPEYDAIVPTLTATVEPSTLDVTVPFTADLPPRRASYYREFGCVLSPIGATFQPLRRDAFPLDQAPAPANPAPWPQGDAGIAPRPSAALASTVASAFDAATYGSGTTTGVVVLRDGKVVAERYAAGWGPLIPNRTWSVAKSMAGTLIGLVRQQLDIDVNAPTRLPEWNKDDPRAAITLDQLMRMASGLHGDTAGSRTDALYFGGSTVSETAAASPLEARPGTRFRYANNDIVLAVRAIRGRMADDDRYLAWPATRLFAPLGMNHTTAGIDWQRNFILSSQVWSTARDFARLGQFWLQDGVWQGKRLLPDGWMRYMTTPSGPQPQGDGPGYGATMWLFGPKQGLPAGSYAAQGNRGQYIMVVPSARLVVVRRGEDAGAARFDIARFTADVFAARP
ncbi:CubicO group peptidase (beta-lactamase class C family) [Sphingomonas jinjuensis]|uniref:CubicO group peptidase (Beta-lactamase class C family) n=1 Tax=Sphingomonas jinjuensis TaxID=535907 RepID=A0A840FIE2_9SPHN|nr:serine hydrolase [Sphingomonas jinjuensis]MBB4153115.1 CubicO group peptidase (beta-lactamase class C family) [Sphingomonas jinjuensis]